MLTTMPLSVALLMLSFSVILGWQIVLYKTDKPVKTPVKALRVISYNLYTLMLLSVGLMLVPGWLSFYLVILGCITLMMTPYYISFIGPFESVTDTALGKQYSKLVYGLYLLSLPPILLMIVIDPYHYMVTIIMHILIGLTVFCSRPPSILHRQQKILMTRKAWLKAETDFINSNR